MKIKMIKKPSKICYLKIMDSSWDTNINKNFFISYCALNKKYNCYIMIGCIWIYP